MVEVSASLLNVEEDESIKTLYNLEIANIDYFHIDVMDGEFVKNNTAEKMRKYSNYAKQISNLPLDIHLMVYDVKKFLDDYIGLSPRIITFHIEAYNDKNEIMDIINEIKKCNSNVGIAIKPETKIEDVYEFLPYIHMVLVMTVEPGEGGQELIGYTVDKIKELKKYISEKNIDIAIEADGGINTKNSHMLQEAGVEIIVAGSAIIKSDDYRETVNLLKE